MYQAYFGMNEKPFSESPDPRFLFLSSRHREGLAHLEYNIMDGKGFSVLVGEVGTGKTTLCRALIDRLDEEKVTVVHIIHTNLDFYEFLQEVVEELGISFSSRQKWDLLKALKKFLIEAYSQNRRVVLIIDEAQNLQPSALEGIRMLSNLETPQEKLIQIVFVGQPELMTHIQRPDMRQLRQRIAGSFFLGPMNCRETKDYILFRLNRVQNKHSLRFSPEALDLVFQYSKGIPRMINFICDFSLMHAFVAESWTVDTPLVQAAYQEFKGGLRNVNLPETRERRAPGRLREISSHQGSGLGLKIPQVSESPPSNKKLADGPFDRMENFFSPGARWRVRTAVVFGLALTVIILTLLFFQEWTPATWSFKTAPPSYQIQIPLTESEKENSNNDSELREKRLGQITYALKEFQINPPGGAR